MPCGTIISDIILSELIYSDKHKYNINNINKQRTEVDGPMFSFTIQDCPSDRMEEVHELFSKYFVNDESILKLSGVAKSDDALKEFKGLMLGTMQEKHIVICIYREGVGTELDWNHSSGRVVGASCMKLGSKSDDKSLTLKLQTKEMLTLIKIMDHLDTVYDVYSNFTVDKCFYDRGIIMHPEYRGYGIGREFVATRRKICKQFDVPVTSAWMTSMTTQKIAQWYKWETVCEVDTQELTQKFDLTPQEDVPPTFKLMVAKV